MAEANLIPGATQHFADILEGGSVKELFANMKKGKYELQDIVKALDGLKGKIKQDQVDQMLMRPTAELEELHTAWQRFIKSLNEKGGLSLMKGVLDNLTVFVKYLGDHTTEITNFFKGLGGIVKILAGGVVILWRVLKSLWSVLTSTWEALGDFKAVVIALAVLYLPALITAITPLAAVIGLVSKAFMRWLIVPAIIFLTIVALGELYNTLNGENTLWNEMATNKDKGLLGWLAAVALSLAEVIKLGAVFIGGGAAWVLAKLNGDQETADMIKGFMATQATQTSEKIGSFDLLGKNTTGTWANRGFTGTPWSLATPTLGREGESTGTPLTAAQLEERRKMSLMSIPTNIRAQQLPTPAARLNQGMDQSVIDKLNTSGVNDVPVVPVTNNITITTKTDDPQTLANLVVSEIQKMTTQGASNFA